ncbi:MAG: hypothetical protein U0Y10_00930 [Spirosomataceae bacterium]
MQQLFFWNTWPKRQGLLYLLSLIGLLLCLINFGIAWFNGLENVLHWDVLSELGELPLPIDQLPAPDSLSVVAKAYFVTEQFLASTMTINYTSQWLFVISWLISFCLLTTAISAMRGVWFYVGMAGVMLTLATLRLESFWGLTGYAITLCLISLYTGSAFYFNAFRPNISLWTRWASFVLITTVLVLIGLQSGPIIGHLATFGLPSMLLVSVGFIFWISFEIVYGLLYMATSNRNDNALGHFSVLSLIYLGNVLVLFLQNTKAVDWNLYTFSPFLLFIVSLILGINGLRQRANLIESSMPFEESGAFVYTGAGIVSVATITYAFATGNDPLVESLEDTIVYSHLIVGILFYLYVFFNFGPIFRQGLEIYKIVYKPRILPLYSVRGMALLLIFIFVQSASYFPVFQGFAGYYNNLGDWYTSRNELKSAEVYYQQALSYEYQNHKTNYSLGSLALLQGDNTTAGGYFRQALLKQPSTYAYAALGSCLLKENLFFDAIFALKEGLRKFPNSGELQNNLGILFDKTAVADSAYYFYAQASQHAHKPEVAQANMLAFWVKKPNLADRNEVQKQFADVSYESSAANLLAFTNILNISKQKRPTPIGNTWQHWILPDSALNIMQFACLYNSAIGLSLNAAPLPERNQAVLPLRQLANQQANTDFYGDLLLADAVQEYYGGDKRIALALVNAQSAADTTKTGEVYRNAYRIWLAHETRFGDEYPAVASPEALETSLKEHPLNASLLQQYAYYCNRQKHPKQAYDAIVEALSHRPNAVPILKLYAFQSLEINMISYAEEALLQLHDLLPPADYQAFLPQYEAKRALVEKGKDAFR